MSHRRFRSPTAHAGWAAAGTPVGVATLSTVHPDMRDRSLEGHPVSIHRKNGGLGCQSALVGDAEHFLGVLLRLLFGAKPLRLARGGAFVQKFNSVVSHVSIVSLTEAQCPLFCAIYGYLRSFAADGALRMRSRSATIAATSPGIVYSLASMSTGSLNSRRVADVTGPMDAVCTPRCGPGFFRAARALRSPSRATKFRTVEELVKVMAWGLRVLLARI